MTFGFCVTRVKAIRVLEYCLPWILVKYWTDIKQWRTRSTIKSQGILCLIVSQKIMIVLANYEYSRRNPDTG